MIYSSTNYSLTDSEILSFSAVIQCLGQKPSKEPHFVSSKQNREESMYGENCTVTIYSG